jgi:hypothetical protein
VFASTFAILFVSLYADFCLVRVLLEVPPCGLLLLFVAGFALYRLLYLAIDHWLSMMMAFFWSGLMGCLHLLNLCPVCPQLRHFIPLFLD